MVEGKALLAMLLSRARFELPKGEVPMPLVRLTLRPKRGLRLKVTLLEHEQRAASQPKLRRKPALAA
jgi:hypothetical protein